MTDLVKRGRIAQHDETQSTGALYGELCDEIERLREALKRQLRHTLNSNLPRAVQDYGFGIKALEEKDD